MKKSFSVKRIAQMTNSSPSSVSRVINKQPGVNSETRSRILDYLQSINYPLSDVNLENSATIASNAFKALKYVALIIGDVRNPFYADITFHVHKLLNEAGYQAVLFNSEYNDEKEIEFLDMAINSNFAGIIVATALDTSEFISIVQQSRCPIVLINRTVEGFTGSSVLLDNFQAGYTATKHLIELGHHRIAFVAGPAHSSTSQQRVLGYRQALENYALKAYSSDIIPGDLTLEAGYRAGKLLMKSQGNPLTGIICGNDLMAIGLIEACQEQNIKIPSDLSVVGFDDIAISRLKSINLTTMRQPIEKMAQRTADIMLHRLLDPDWTTQRIILESELIIRGTTAAPSVVIQ
jgi:LacI family transcriptional regulator